MKRLFFFMLSLVCVSGGCGKNYSDIFADIDCYIEERPDSALVILEGIDKELLRTHSERAKYALLYSMALDKNYIDVTADSIIAPAVNYYSRHGSAAEKLMAYYYKGVTYENAGDYDAAMENFIKAEHYVENCRNMKAAGRLYSHKMLIYSHVYDLHTALEQGQLAAECFMLAKDTLHYLNEILNLASQCRATNEYGQGRKYLEIVKDNWQYVPDDYKSRYYSIMLDVSQKVDDMNTSDLIEEYLASVSEPAMVRWMGIASAFLSIGENERALDALHSYNKYVGKHSASYYYIASKVYQAVGDSENAMDAYCNYFTIVDHSNAEVLKSDTKFIEERRNAEFRSYRQKMHNIILAMSLAIICLIAIILFDRIKRIKKETSEQKVRHEAERERLVREKEETEQMLISLKNEMASLKKIHRNNSSFDKETLDIVGKRLDVLNAFVLAEQSDNLKKNARSQMQTLLEDRDAFMVATSKTFMLSHSGFIAYLIQCGLTEWEIGCCCLYCIGFSGSDVAEFLNRKAIYNVNSAIRNKLGIPKGRSNIDLFLKQKMSELD